MIKEISKYVIANNIFANSQYRIMIIWIGLAISIGVPLVPQFEHNSQNVNAVTL